MQWPIHPRISFTVIHGCHECLTVSESDGIVDRGAVRKGDVDWRVGSRSDDESIRRSPVVGGKLEIRAFELKKKRRSKSQEVTLDKESAHMRVARHLWRYLQRRL